MVTPEIPRVIDTTGQVLRAFPEVRFHYDPPPAGASPGKFVQLGDIGLDSRLAAHLLNDFPRGLYRHQAVAFSHIFNGENTVVATRTSSGKSLIYYVPVFDALFKNEETTALFIYPQKALANDQLTKLHKFAKALPMISDRLGKSPHVISRYDGATTNDHRPLVRSQAQIVLTNPDMLHVAILQYHERHWSRFFANLRYVIIDECHEYRGIFGTNVAYLLRRLRQICELNRTSPCFIATSATIREPQEHLEKLTGMPFVSVGPETDGSMQGTKKFWVVSGPEHFYELGRKVALELAKQGLSVLAFCPSRLAAERMMAKVLSSKDDELAFVRVYRAGLSAEQREEIENGLRDKTVRLVFSTSALELGIDIGALDAVVCVGVPSSMMSLRQRTGRVARTREGAIILIPADTPVDSYYAEHPDELFARENEPLALNLHNRRVVYCHYACAVTEVGGVDDHLRLGVLGEAMRTVHDLRAEGTLSDDIFYRSDPHMSVSIRSMGEGSYTLQCAGDKIGEIDDFHLLREAYRNAIYRHGGVPYRVKDVIKGKRLVVLERAFTWNETNAFLQKQIRLKRRNAVAEYAQLLVATVDIDVTEFIVNVIEKDRAGKVIRQWQGAAGMPAHTLPTVGTLLLLRRRLWENLTAELGADAKSALTSCERLLVSLFPTISGPCDTQDFSSFSDVIKDGSAAVYLYDMVYDGVDLTTGAFDKMDPLIDKSLARLDACDCATDAGCFRCIANPRVDEKTSRFATRRLLLTIQQILRTECPTITKSTVTSIDALTAEVLIICPSCSTVISQGDRFCRNCGNKVI
jgi:DEAD/DEAH box helicase domain-containing protein